MDFLTGVIVPFTFFPEWFQQVVAWLPFQAISYVPVTIYLGKRPGDRTLARPAAAGGLGGRPLRWPAAWSGGARLRSVVGAGRLRWATP